LVLSQSAHAILLDSGRASMDEARGRLGDGAETWCDCTLFKRVGPV